MFNKRWGIVCYVANNPANPKIISTHYTYRGASNARYHLVMAESERRKALMESTIYPIEMAQFHRMRGFKFRIREAGWL